MEKITCLSTYLDKYAVFYLSKYSVTKEKFKIILLRKLKRDISNKKLNKNQYEDCKTKIPFLIQKFVDNNVINDERNIERRIESLVSKGSSVRKIIFMLSQDYFDRKLIEKKIEDLKQIENYEIKLILNYCKKRKIILKTKDKDLSDKLIYQKNLHKLLREGFSLENSKKFLDQN